MPFYFNEESGRGISTNMLGKPSGPGWTSYPSISYYNTMVANKSGVNSVAARSAAADLPQTGAGGIDFEAVRERLTGNQAKSLEAGSADIDQRAYQASQLSQSNLIGAGLSGTTVVGGEQVGIGDAANKAKAGLSSQLQDKTDALNLGYAGLQQSASESQANRDVTAATASRSRTASRAPSGSSMPAPTATTSAAPTSTGSGSKRSGPSRMGYTSKGVFSPQLLAMQQASGYKPPTAPAPAINVAGKSLSISSLSQPGEVTTARDALLNSNFGPKPTAGPLRR